MPRYYVYDVKTGAIVHRHEHYNAAQGTSVPCSREDVLSLVDPTLQRESLDVLEEVEPGVERALRVDVQKRELIKSTE